MAYFASKNAEHLKVAKLLKQLTGCNVTEVSLWYIKHPPTGRTFPPNKMAAQFSTLISLFLDSIPVSYTHLTLPTKLEV